MDKAVLDLRQGCHRPILPLVSNLPPASYLANTKQDDLEKSSCLLIVF